MYLLNKIKNITIPLLGFTTLVSTGFGAWVFLGSMSSSYEISSTQVNVTSVNDSIGKLEINDRIHLYETPYILTFEVGSGEDFTSNEFGVELSNNIEYKFYEFYQPEENYGYYLSYRVIYSANSIYDQYVVIKDLANTGTNEADGRLYQESHQTLLDPSLFNESSTLDEAKNPYYELNDDLYIDFNWKEHTKPISASAYSAFLSSVHDSSINLPIEIELKIMYQQIN